MLSVPRSGAMRRVLISGLLGGVAQAAFLSPALAQSPAAAPDLEEVVVTARRVEESLQDVPVAVTAISQREIREKNIVNPTEVQFHAPSVQMTTVYGRLSGGFAVRGLAGGTTTYFADVAGGPTDASSPLYDIGSIQVLNGPQGTLFGRANTAGAVLITPNRPSFDGREGYVEGALGNLGLNRFTAVANLPVFTDELALRVAVNRNHLDGYTRTIPTGQRLNESNSWGARASLAFQPSGSRFKSYAVLDFLDIDQASGGYVLAGVNPNIALFNLPTSIDAPNGLSTGTAVFGGACTAAVNAGLQASLNGCIDQRLRIAATFLPTLQAELARVNGGGDKALRSTLGGFENLERRESLRKWTFVNQSEYDFGDVGFTSIRLRNTFGFQAVTGTAGWAVDGVGGLIQSAVAGDGPIGLTPSAQQVGNRAMDEPGPYQKTWSNETQLLGVVGEDRLIWNLGSYYQYTPYITNLSGVRNVSRVFSGITLPTQGFNPSFPYPNGGYTKQSALFAQGTLDVSGLAPFLAALHLTGGLRKSWDEQELNHVSVVTDIASGRYTVGTRLPASYTKSSGWNSTLSLDAQVTQDLLVYVASRKGYRPGGINSVLNAELFPNFTPTYAPETVKDYEIGLKYDFAIGAVRGRLNAAAYQTDYTNIQRVFSGSVAGVTAIFTGNAAAARIKGAEFQGQLAVGGVSLSGHYAYTDGQFTEWVGSDPLNLIRPGNPRCLAGSTTALCLIDLENTPFPNNPRHQGSVTVRYALPLDPSLGDISVQATAYAQSRRYFVDSAQRNIETFGAAVRDAVSQPAYQRYNLRADWRNIRGRPVSISAFVNNVTNEPYAISTVSQLHSLGNTVKLYAEPRTYGVELRYEFGN